MIAEIIIETKSDLDTFSYIVPPELNHTILIGSVVRVPFGKRKIRGVIREVHNRKVESKYALRMIEGVLDYQIPAVYLNTAEWIQNYYLCSLGEAISLFLPPDLKRPQKVVSSKQKAVSCEPIVLNNEQQQIFDELKPQLVAKKKKPALIFGVTGSGKTEIYIKMIEEVLIMGKKAIVLVPEIILTPQTVERLEKHFDGQVTLMHSNLSQSERYGCYFNFSSGKKPIIIGPRSALLVPAQDIGLIIIDEEQEDAYKQEQNPRYHAVELAKQIAAEIDGLLLLGSATPRVESYYLARSGEYSFFELKERFLGQLPECKIVDLKDEIRAKNFSVLSNLLQAEIENNLTANRQTLLFLNRRGTSTFISCRDCGHIILCKDCSIPMVYHISGINDQLVCHHCDWKQKAPAVCPECGSSRIKYFGAGIEKVEREIRTNFPNAKVFRVDSTTIKSKKDYDFFYSKFKNHEVDIVIGTQMIAKGFDIPNVDLVGIISADTGLNMPHFRAAEKSFQILTQVSGRSGRRENIGKTILQTYWPEALAIKSASTHDYLTFYESEIKQREKFGYPPFKRLIRVLSENVKKETAADKIGLLAKELRLSSIDFIGPAPCFYEKLHNRYRYQIIVKSDIIPNKELSVIFKKHSHLTYDIDPSNLL